MCFLGVGDHGGGPNEHMIEWVKENKDAIPGARMVEIPGPHIVVLEEPAGFAAAVDEHFAWVEQQVGVR